MERVLKAEEALEQLVLAIQDIATKEELEYLYKTVKDVLKHEFKEQRHRFDLTDYTF